MRTLWLLAFVALAFLPAALAHGAPSPTGAYVRLLADDSDDCGGDGVASACNGSHDLIALDVREALQDGEPVVVFHFILDQGQAGDNSDTLTFTANGHAHTYMIESTDGHHFTGTFDRVADAQPVFEENTATPDGTRFSVDAWLRYTTLGIDDGATLAGFGHNAAVQAKHGSTLGDKLPGTYWTPLGDGPAPAADSDCGCPYQLDSYSVRGVQVYARVSADAPTIRVAATRQHIVSLEVDNPFDNQAQRLNLSVSGADGVTAQFHSVTGEGEYSDTAILDVAAGSPAYEHLFVTGNEAGKSGTLVVQVDSDQGGRTVLRLPYTVTDAPASGEPTPTNNAPSTTGHNSPGPAPFFAALAVLAAVAVARRR